nr:MAG TPA: hypothetical protein [Caudoviricetes sp.]
MLGSLHTKLVYHSVNASKKRGQISNLKLK